MVRAKFIVTKIEQSQSSRESGEFTETGHPIYKPCEMRTIVLSPVYSTDPAHENKKFWDFTPSGEIQLGTINEAAWSQFGLGKSYYIDFTPAGE